MSDPNMTLIIVEYEAYKRNLSFLLFPPRIQRRARPIRRRVRHHVHIRPYVCRGGVGRFHCGLILGVCKDGN
ncbi:hypothetical protein SK128_002621 [Halocaridina rubra]|uniref:Uncharacterized protein n=1 Tax=Halocaridina rubra TaxID=373956 RepID=A0AAN9AHQ4_HALRR